MRILIGGHSRHGKDTVAELLGLPFESSSMAAAHEVVFPAMRSAYSTAEECFNDRHNRRAEWYRLISEYNQPDPTRLARRVLEKSSVYVGMRNRLEFLACRHARLFDITIWVDASKRLPPEGDDSITVLAHEFDIVIDNNGTIEALREKVDRLKPLLGGGLQKGIREWADTVYPDRNVADAFNKMVFEEIPEFFRSNNAEELGDIGILLYDVANLVGVDLEAAIKAKMAINKARQWEIDPETRIMRHVKGEEA